MMKMCWGVLVVTQSGSMQVEVRQARQPLTQVRRFECGALDSISFPSPPLHPDISRDSRLRILLISVIH
jgi:hypothetical protein